MRRTWGKGNTKRERGATLVEYSLLVALLCVVAIGGTRAVGAAVADRIDKANTGLIGSGGVGSVGGGGKGPGQGGVGP